MQASTPDLANIFPAFGASGKYGFAFKSKKALLFNFVKQYRQFPLPDNLHLPEESVYFVSVDEIIAMKGQIIVAPMKDLRNLSDILVDNSFIRPVCYQGELGLACSSYAAYIDFVIRFCQDIKEEDILESLPENEALFISLTDIMSNVRTLGIFRSMTTKPVESPPATASNDPRAVQPKEPVGNASKPPPATKTAISKPPSVATISKPLPAAPKQISAATTATSNSASGGGYYMTSTPTNVAANKPQSIGAVVTGVAPEVAKPLSTPTSSIAAITKSPPSAAAASSPAVPEATASSPAVSAAMPAAKPAAVVVPPAPVVAQPAVPAKEANTSSSGAVPAPPAAAAAAASTSMEATIKLAIEHYNRGRRNFNTAPLVVQMAVKQHAASRKQPPAADSNSGDNGKTKDAAAAPPASRAPAEPPKRKKYVYINGKRVANNTVLPVAAVTAVTTQPPAQQPAAAASDNAAHPSSALEEKLNEAVADGSEEVSPAAVKRTPVKRVKRPEVDHTRPTRSHTQGVVAIDMSNLPEYKRKRRVKLEDVAIDEENGDAAEETKPSVDGDVSAEGGAAATTSKKRKAASADGKEEATADGASVSVVEAEEEFRRIDGPSDVVGAMKQNKAISRVRASASYWRHLTHVGWKEEQWTFEDKVVNVMVVPFVRKHDLRVEDSPLIENVEYFHGKHALKAFTDANPAVLMKWDQLWPKLLAQGWRFIGNKVNFSYQYHGSGRTSDLVAGVHKFKSLFTLMQHISKFPYPLQDDESLSKTLEKFNYHQTKNLDALRKVLWWKPQLLMHNLPFEGDFREVFGIPVQAANLMVEPYIGQERVVHILSVVDAIRDRFEKKQRGQIHTIHKELLALGWKIEKCLWSPQWWRHLFCYLPPWASIDKADGDQWVRAYTGIDVFWDLSDIATFIECFGEAALFTRPYFGPTRSIPLRITPAMTVKDVVHWIVSTFSEHQICFSEYPVVELLKMMQWKFVDFKILVPPWKGSALSWHQMKKNTDYFDKSDVESCHALLTLLCTIPSWTEVGPAEVAPVVAATAASERNVKAESHKQTQATMPTTLTVSAQVVLTARQDAPLPAAATAAIAVNDIPAVKEATPSSPVAAPVSGDVNTTVASPQPSTARQQLLEESPIMDANTSLSALFSNSAAATDAALATAAAAPSTANLPPTKRGYPVVVSETSSSDDMPDKHLTADEEWALKLEAMDAIAIGRYPAPQITALGWQWEWGPRRKSYCIPPWSAGKIIDPSIAYYKGRVKSFEGFMENVDYFEDKNEVVKYIAKHGFCRISHNTAAGASSSDALIPLGSINEAQAAAGGGAKKPRTELEGPMAMLIEAAEKHSEESNADGGAASESSDGEDVDNDDGDENGDAHSAGSSSLQSIEATGDKKKRRRRGTMRFVHQKRSNQRRYDNSNK